MSERSAFRRLADATEAPDAGQRFQLRDAFGPAALIDSGLPTLAFVIAFGVSGRQVALSAWVAVAAGALLAVFRLVRRQSIQNVVAGFIAVGIAAWFAARTGRAENFFLPGLLINAGYALGYAISNLVRWPLIGVLVALVTAEGMGWRNDPRMRRAFTTATWIWVGLFVIRLVVQFPLWLIGEPALAALTVAKLAMGWPLTFLCLYLSWLVIRPIYRSRTGQVAGPQQEQLQGTPDERT